MATFKSDIVSKYDAARTGLPDGLVDGDDGGGLVLRAKAIVTLDAATATNDIMELVDLPPGAVWSPELSSVSCSADPGTALTLDVGTATNPDAYADGIDLASGGQVAFTSGTMPSAVGTTVRQEDVARIIATVKAATAPTAGVKLVFTIVYVVKG